MSSKLRSTFAVILCFILCAVLCPAAFAEGETAPVTVIFSCEDESALPCLHVFDLSGNEYAPMTVESSGEVQHGRFLLVPGEYSYSFHDEDGRYEDTTGSTSIDPALIHFIPLHLTLNIEVQNFSFTYINPVYIDEITEEDLPQSAIPEEALIAEARHLSERLNDAHMGSSIMFYSDSGTIHTNVQDAGAELKPQILNHEALVTIYLSVNGRVDEALWKQLGAEVFSVAITHTGIPTEGDYIRYEYGGYNASGAISYTQATDTTICTFKYQPNYFTTIEQEAELTPVVDNILAQLDLSGKSDYHKIRAIYDHLCSTIDYDYDNLYNDDYKLKYTAYAALINHTAICQGYSTAFYRLCLSAGVDTRIITATSIKHAWNIAALDGLYYELDATWDSNYTPATYKYFLKGSTGWPTSSPTAHKTIGDQFANSNFANAHPLSAADAPAPLTVIFDSSGGSSISSQLLMSGDLLIRPSDPTKNGYWFTGWYADSGFKTLFDFDTAVTADTTIYARWAVPDFVLPSALAQIGEEAFSGGAFSFAVLPENAVAVGPMAFAECAELAFIYIPASVVNIDSTAFGDLKGITVLGASSATPSTAETFASSHGYAFVPIR